VKWIEEVLARALERETTALAEDEAPSTTQVAPEVVRNSDAVVKH
jgi:hypothetical protein